MLVLIQVIFDRAENLIIMAKYVNEEKIMFLKKRKNI